MKRSRDSGSCRESSYRLNFRPAMRQSGARVIRARSSVKTLVLSRRDFPTMLFHIAAATVLTNIAFLEIYSFYDLREAMDVQLLADENPLHRVFVYGTLKRGEPNHSLIQDAANGYAKFLGLGKTTVPYPLIIATKYNIPFLLKKPGVGHHVSGEVYDVDTKMLKKLDELEEHPSFYERSEESVIVAPEAKVKANDNFEAVGTLMKAWIYFIPKFRSSLLDSPMYSSYSNEGSHGLKYCEKYVREPSYNHRNEVQSP